MFESHARLEEQILTLLEGVRRDTGARYAAVLDGSGVRLESYEPASEEHGLRLHHLLERRKTDVFAIPAALAADQPLEDAFEEWREDEFVLAFLNRRVALVLAGPDAEAARARLDRPLKILADRLFRYEPRWRIDARGRGFFFGRATVDIVVVGGR